MINVKRLPDYTSADRIKINDWIFIPEWKFQGLCKGWWRVAKIQNPVPVDAVGMQSVYKTKIKPLPPVDEIRRSYLFYCEILRKDVHVEDEELTGFLMVEKSRSILRMKPCETLE